MGTVTGDGAGRRAGGWSKPHGGGYQATASGPSESARLSRLLFEAREQIDMWSDIVVRATGSLSAADEPRRVRDEIDAYRAEQGWSPHGFGGETS